jgi:hypothetical protein
MQSLEELINTLESFVPKSEVKNTEVSQATIGWQIEHSLLVLNGVITQLELSNPEEFSKKFNLKKFIIFTTKKIPRGKVRAPKTVTPTEETTQENLLNNLQTAKKNVEKMKVLPKNAFFKHPFFDNLNKKDTYKFLQLHTIHHVKIIEEIAQIKS